MINLNLSVFDSFNWDNIDWASLVVPEPGAKAVAPAPVKPVVDERTQRAAKAAMTPTTPTAAASPAPSPTQTTVASPASVKAADEAKSVPAVTPAKEAAESPTLTNTTAVANKFTSASVTATTREERMDELQRARESRMASEAMSRAQADPMANYAVRPAAPEADENFIYYYSWIGGVNTGNWKLYRAPNTPDNQAKYGSRAVGGSTQATASSAVGANALKTQPQPI